MADLVVTQVIREVIGESSSDLRVTQIVREVIGSSASDLRVTQVLRDVITLPALVSSSFIPSGATLYPPSVAGGSQAVSGASIASTAVLYPPHVNPTPQAIVGAYIASSAQIFAPTVAAGGVSLPTIPSTVVLRPPTITFSGVAGISLAFIASGTALYPPWVWATWAPEPDTPYDPALDARGRTIGLVWIEAYLPD